MTVLANIDPLV